MYCKLSETQIQSIILEYQNGKNSAELGKKYKVHAVTILHQLKKHKIPIHNKNITHRKYQLNQEYFNQIDTEEKAYWLGFLAGDGSVRLNTIKLELSIKDEEHIKKFAKSIESNHPIKYDRNNVYIQVNSELMRKSLEKYNIIHRKTYTVKSLPNHIPENLMRHYMRGLFDADGWSCKSKRKNSFDLSFGVCSSSQNIILQIQKWFNSQDINGGYTTKTANMCWALSFTGNKQFCKIYKLLYHDANLVLDRKHIKNQNFIKDLQLIQ